MIMERRIQQNIFDTKSGACADQILIKSARHWTTESRHTQLDPKYKHASWIEIVRFRRSNRIDELLTRQVICKVIRLVMVSRDQYTCSNGTQFHDQSDETSMMYAWSNLITELLFPDQQKTSPFLVQMPQRGSKIQINRSLCDGIDHIIYAQGSKHISKTASSLPAGVLNGQWMTSTAN